MSKEWRMTIDSSSVRKENGFHFMQKCNTEDRFKTVPAIKTREMKCDNLLRMILSVNFNQNQFTQFLSDSIRLGHFRSLQFFRVPFF